MSCREADRRRRSDGERSRNAILREATQLATVEGIDGLSISRLADAVGMSKSGLFAHFGSKEELQLATIDDRELRLQRTGGRARDCRRPSALERLRQLAENFLGTSRTTSSPAAASSPRWRPRWTRTPAPCVIAPSSSRSAGSACSRQAVRMRRQRVKSTPAKDPRQLGVRARRVPPARQRAVHRHRRVGAPSSSRVARSTAGWRPRPPNPGRGCRSGGRRRTRSPSRARHRLPTGGAARTSRTRSSLRARARARRSRCEFRAGR